MTTNLHYYVRRWFVNQTRKLEAMACAYPNVFSSMGVDYTRYKPSEYMGWEENDLVVGVAATIPPDRWPMIPNWPLAGMVPVVDWLNEHFRGTTAPEAKEPPG